MRLIHVMTGLGAARRRDDRGVVLVLVALTLALVAVMAAFAIDLGFARQEARHVQGSADAAALAAAQELPLLAPDQASAASAKDVAAELIAENLGGARLVAEVPCEGSVPPNSTCYVAGDAEMVVATPYSAPDDGPPAHSLVYVSICEPSETFFGGVVGATEQTVCRDAVGYRQNSGGGYGYGLVSLDPSACPGTNFSGNSDTVLTSNGAVLVNSACESGALASNGSSWTLQAAYIGVVGGTNLKPCDPAETSKCTQTLPQTGIPHFDDPLATVPEPARPPVTERRSCSGKKENGVVVLQPGLYDSHCKLNDKVYVLRPGVYYFEEGFRVNGSADFLCANEGHPKTPGSACDGVTMFIRSGGFRLNGDSYIDLPPPASGPYQGISIFQSRSDTSGSIINGGNQSNLGTVYTPAARPLTFTGNGAIDITGMVVADTVDLSGNFNLTINIPDDADGPTPADVIGLWQ